MEKKPINEGGGAGIRISCEARDLNMRGAEITILNGNVIKMEGVTASGEVEVSVNKFSAEGYMDGMSDVDGRVLKLTGYLGSDFIKTILKQLGENDLNEDIFKPATADDIRQRRSEIPIVIELSIDTYSDNISDTVGGMYSRPGPDDFSFDWDDDIGINVSYYSEGSFEGDLDGLILDIHGELNEEGKEWFNAVFNPPSDDDIDDWYWEDVKNQYGYAKKRLKESKTTGNKLFNYAFYEDIFKPAGKEEVEKRKALAAEEHRKEEEERKRQYQIKLAEMNKVPVVFKPSDKGPYKGRTTIELLGKNILIDFTCDVDGGSRQTYDDPGEPAYPVLSTIDSAEDKDGNSIPVTEAMIDVAAESIDIEDVDFPGYDYDYDDYHENINEDIFAPATEKDLAQRSYETWKLGRPFPFLQHIDPQEVLKKGYGKIKGIQYDPQERSEIWAKYETPEITIYYDEDEIAKNGLYPEPQLTKELKKSGMTSEQWIESLTPKAHLQYSGYSGNEDPHYFWGGNFNYVVFSWKGTEYIIKDGEIWEGDFDEFWNMMSMGDPEMEIGFLMGYNNGNYDQLIQDIKTWYESDGEIVKDQPNPETNPLQQKFPFMDKLPVREEKAVINTAMAGLNEKDVEEDIFIPASKKELSNRAKHFSNFQYGTVVRLRREVSFYDYETGGTQVVEKGKVGKIINLWGPGTTPDIPTSPVEVTVEFPEGSAGMFSLDDLEVVHQMGELREDIFKPADKEELTQRKETHEETTGYAPFRRIVSQLESLIRPPHLNPPFILDDSITWINIFDGTTAQVIASLELLEDENDDGGSVIKVEDHWLKGNDAHYDVGYEENIENNAVKKTMEVLKTYLEDKNGSRNMPDRGPV